MKARWYQEEAADALFETVKDNKSTNPIAVLPTGAGKTFTLCLLIDKILTNNPKNNVLVLSHVREIIEQNHSALKNYFDGCEIGLYSAGLGSRNIHKITVAGIQSIHNKQQLFNEFDIVIIDECHLISTKSNTMYRKFLSTLEGNFIGLTATHFRLNHGYIHKGEGALFNHIAYDLSSPDKFNRLIKEGFLSKLITKNTLISINADAEKIKTTAGDFNQKELSLAFDRSSITNAAVQEIIKFGKNYKLWLIFAIDIAHAEHVNDFLKTHGIESICVHSKMECDRKVVIDDIKNGVYRAVVNVDILTTGFDAPNVDLIAMLRPTKSPVIHVQAIGRGLRVAENKNHCLVLDFAGNTERLGPINQPYIRERGKKDGIGGPILKKCPECLVLAHPTTKICEGCGHEFVFKETLSQFASNSAIIYENKSKWLDINQTTYSIHQKKGKPSSLRVTYRAGLLSFSEWIAYDHTGYAGHKARNWVKNRWMGGLMPSNVPELYKQTMFLEKPSKIFVNHSKRYPEIIDYEFI